MENNVTSNDIWRLITLLIAGITFLFFLATLILIFPIFVLVHIWNREKDRGMTVYPITNHFFKAICFFYFWILSFIALSIYKWDDFVGVDFDTDEFPALDLCILAIMALIALILVHIHHFILSLLAFQRFLIYFFPNFEKIENFSVIWVYIVFYAGFAIFITVTQFFYYHGYVGLFDVYLVAYPIYYGILNFILFASASLYIPIVISIRKLEHLSSAEQFQPHRYILNQTKFVIAFKIVHVFAFLNTWYQGGSTFSSYFFLFGAIDMFSTPLTIQMSYLMSNKRNTEIVKRRLAVSRIFKCSKVEPYRQQQSLDETTTAPM